MHLNLLLKYSTSSDLCLQPKFPGILRRFEHLHSFNWLYHSIAFLWPLGAQFLLYFYLVVCLFHWIMMSFVQSHAVAAINGRFVMNSKYYKYIHEKALKLPEIRSKIIESSYIWSVCYTCEHKLKCIYSIVVFNSIGMVSQVKMNSIRLWQTVAG